MVRIAASMDPDRYLSCLTSGLRACFVSASPIAHRLSSALALVYPGVTLPDDGSTIRVISSAPFNVRSSRRCYVCLTVSLVSHIAARLSIPSVCGLAHRIGSDSQGRMPLSSARRLPSDLLMTCHQFPCSLPRGLTLVKCPALLPWPRLISKISGSVCIELYSRTVVNTGLKTDMVCPTNGCICYGTNSTEVC